MKENMMNDKLYVITCIFNPENYHSRYNLYFNFEKYMKQHENVELIVVELAFNDQQFVVTDKDNRNHIQLRTSEILWFKENLLNIGIKHAIELYDAKNIAWIDADIEFSNENWIQDTIDQLKITPFVQMFEYGNDLDSDENVLSRDKSFIARWIHNDFTEKKRGRSGLAWAATAKALKDVGYLIDWGIVGSADWYMAFALTNQITNNNMEHKTGGFSNTAMQQWYDLTKEHINGNVGYIDGDVNHFWHGKKSDRGYNWRWKILNENQFNPLTDLNHKENGLITISSDKPQLMEDIKFYFKSRKEDET